MSEQPYLLSIEEINKRVWLKKLLKGKLSMKRFQMTLAKLKVHAKCVNACDNYIIIIHLKHLQKIIGVNLSERLRGKISCSFLNWNPPIVFELTFSRLSLTILYLDRSSSFVLSTSLKWKYSSKNGYCFINPTNKELRHQ